jgi:hypothetical protein
MARNPFKRSVSVPSAVLARASLDKSEKVLAGIPARDGSWLLGTRDALLLVAGEDAVDGPARIPWQRIERADWNRDEELLVITEVGEFGQVRPEHSFVIEDPGLLLELVRERVTASVVLQRRVVVDGKRGLFVIARRAPHGAGEVTWAYQFDRGVDPSDPAVMAAAERGLEVAAEELGL